MSNYHVKFGLAFGCFKSVLAYISSIHEHIHIIIKQQLFLLFFSSCLMFLFTSGIIIVRNNLSGEAVEANINANDASC